MGKNEKETEAYCPWCKTPKTSIKQPCTKCGWKTDPITKFAGWRDAIALAKGEYVVEHFNLSDLHYSETKLAAGLSSCAFVLTNLKLVVFDSRFIEEQDGRIVVSIDLQREFPLEGVKDIYKDDMSTVIFTDEGKYNCGQESLIWSSGGASDNFFQPIALFRYFRDKLIEQKQRKATVTIDFSSLKSLIEKGGIVLTTLACPMCNGPLRIPTDGTETVCQHCGGTVYAQDIFKKLKTLLS